MRAGQRHSGQGPEHVEEVARVPGVALGAVRGDAHAREVRGGLGVAEQVEQQRGDAVLAVVVVRLDPRMVVAVGDAALADVEADQPRALLDRRVERRIVDARLARQDEGDA